MSLFFEIIKFLFYSLLIVAISKYVLVKILRKFAESLSLKPKVVGNIAGISTSVPELLTVSLSSITGLIDASIYNVISSNVINFIQYIASVIINKNVNILQNKAIRIDLGIVIITIIIPLILTFFNIGLNIILVPIFILLFVIFYYINTNSHKLYLSKQENKLQEEIQKEEKWIQGKKSLILRYGIYLLLTGIMLFVVGNLLSETLENLCNIFNIPQFLIGIALGFTTSIPELITFFESQRHYNKTKEVEEGVVEATNNLLTSNMLNLFIIQSIGIVLLKL